MDILSLQARERICRKQIWGRKDRGMKAEQEALLRVIFKLFEAQ